MRGGRRTAAAAIAPVLILGGLIGEIAALVCSAAVAAEDVCGSSYYHCCPTPGLRVLVGLGLVVLSMGAVALVVLSGVWLQRYARGEGERWRWRIVIAPVGAVVLLGAWGFAVLEFLASQGAFS